MKSTTQLLIAASFLFIASVPFNVLSQTSKGQSLSPQALVADLYRQHKLKHSPFFQTRSRALIYKYFEKRLADLIWKDALTSKGEVGVIDGDPLYDAQDTEIKKFAIKEPRFEAGRALVDVNFENFGKPQTITFIVIKGKTGWRIRDIVYGEGRTLLGEFKESRPQ
jgi:Protein of unknown function (DUF3828)